MVFIVPDQNGTDGYPLPDIFVHRHALIGVQSLVPSSAVRYRQGWNARKSCPQADAVQVSSIPHPAISCRASFPLLAARAIYAI